MHPNLYLRTFWRPDFRPEVFVAMSFAGTLAKRFKEVIEPAIQAVTHRGRQLKANRVDLSQSGDSILTDIADGIAHAELVLADVSSVGKDAKTGDSYRNGNVMYEVGLALATRQPSEVLLVRDDRDPFLFDVSTVPHKHIDFTDRAAAKEDLAETLVLRLKERDHLADARLFSAAATLTSGERKLLERFASYGPEKTFWLTNESIPAMGAVQRLLDKQMILTTGVTKDGHATYRWTRLGYVLAKNLEAIAPVIPGIPETEVEK